MMMVVDLTGNYFAPGSVTNPILVSPALAASDMTCATLS
jgi:hypothetical protein